MPYHYIMANLLAEVDEALAVLFVDGSGESVEVASAELPPDDVRITGAYLGIYLRRLATVAESAALGEPRALHFEIGALHTFAVALPEGYSLALLQRRPALSGSARAGLTRAVAAMRREVFHL